MILVTGASGKTGRAVIKSCVSHGKSVRAWVHNLDQAKSILDIGAKDVVTGDLLQEKAMDRACDGIDAIYLICPNMSPNEYEIGINALRAAKLHSVGLFVYHSVFHPQISLMPHHWNKYRVEEIIFKSGIQYVILQPTAYMQNLLPYWPQIINDGIYRLPYSAKTRLSMVDLEDVAEVVAQIFDYPKLWGGTYELVGTGPLTQADVAEMIGKTICKPVHFDALPRSEWEQSARRSGMNEFSIQTLLKMFEYYEKFGMWGSPQVLQGLLNRSPKSFEEFLASVTQK
jgi:NAD(P)H dehydrogenase (quinone)